MRSTIVALSFAALAAAFACAPAKPTTDAKPAGAATPKPPLTGMPRWTDGEGDLADAAAVLSDDGDLKKFRDEHADILMKSTESVYQNILALDGMTAERFMASMHGMHESLGVRCTFCHDPQNFASDEKNEKKAARNMLFVAQKINADHFAGKTVVTCWTCHRGKEKPERPTEMAKKIAEVAVPPGVPVTDDMKVPAGKFYKNLQRLDTLPAPQLMFAMKAISVSLGKDCAFCHDMTDYSSDAKKEKVAAREMMSLA
ncbi:MAG TPA: c-type cytochrome, partial [bacterium]|nr:c-type cytochrome [bacterium]